MQVQNVQLQNVQIQNLQPQKYIFQQNVQTWLVGVVTLALSAKDQFPKGKLEYYVTNTLSVCRDQYPEL